MSRFNRAYISLDFLWVAVVIHMATSTSAKMKALAMHTTIKMSLHL